MIKRFRSKHDGIFDRFKKAEPAKPNYTDIDSNEKAVELAGRGILSPLYLMPLRFNGEESDQNRLFVPPVVVELKDRYDDMVEDLLVAGKVNGYSCSPQYKGKSLIPSAITIAAKKDGNPVFTQTIEIW